MSDLNRANRQVCDLDIRILATKAPFMKFETANVTTVGLTGESAYAMAKGSRRIAFANPMEGTMTVECQVYPFKLFALLSDGVISSTGVHAKNETIEAVEGGKLTLTPGAGGTVTGTVFVYPHGSYGDETTLIAGSYSGGKFTATTAGNIALGSKYDVGYMVTKTSGIRKISFANNKLPQDFYITMETLDKDEEGNLTPFLMTAYKATPQRTWELSFNSEGDPASVTLTFDLLEDKDGNILDMIEIPDDGVMSVSVRNVSIDQGATASDIKIFDFVGAVTAAITTSGGTSYAKIHAVVSGDNDSVIIYADDDAATGNYVVTLTDEKPQTVEIAVTITEAA